MIKNLRDGLVLRSLSEGYDSDSRDLTAFYQRVFTEAGDEEPMAIGAWCADLLSGNHPTVTLDDIWVVVDPAHDDKIVSALLLIPQTWRYGVAEIGVGRVELVATDSDYRRRGLVRALMETAHERSAELGHVMQVITGIPNYYRRFGYTMTVELGAKAIIPFTSIPALAEDAQSYTIRPAVEDDAPQLAAWDAYYADACLMSTVRTESEWRYEISGRTYGAVFHMHIGIIVNPAGDEVGYVAARTSPEYPVTSIMSYIVGEGASYLDTFDDVLRWYKQIRDNDYPEDSEVKASEYLGVDSGVSQAVFEMLNYNGAAVQRNQVYAWYVRVPDVAAFLQTVTPALEQHLAGSVANRFTGELTIGFYDFTGVKLTFEDGKLTTVEQVETEHADVSFPDLNFLHVLMGYRSRVEVRSLYTEAFAGRKGGILLDVLFPKKRSWLMAWA